MPKVSVIIPVYQSVSTIEDAIKSVVSQTYKDVEIILVDDGSTDCLVDKVEPFREYITYIKQNNAGASAARNNGIRHAKGEYIAFLDADDIWLPDKLAKQIEFLDLNPDVGLVFGDIKFLYNDQIQAKTYFEICPPHRGKVFLELFRVNFIPILSVVVRKHILDQIGYFDERIKYAEDYQLWLRISKEWKLDYIASTVALYRIHDKQITRNFTKAAESLLHMKQEMFILYRELFNGADNSILERGLYNKYLRLVLCYLRDGMVEDASSVLGRYIRVRGLTLFGFIFAVLVRLPRGLSKYLVRVWDRFYQKPEVGFY